MPERTEAQRKKTRDYQRKRYARLKQEQAEAASDAQIKAAAARLGASVERDYGPKAKRAATKAPATRLAYMIPRLVDLTLALRKAGCRMAICTFTDGSKITLR
jgi:hypothetical protein